MKSIAIGSLVVARISSRTAAEHFLRRVVLAHPLGEHREQVGLLDVLFAGQREKWRR